jgi:hypothetical protein
VNAVTWQDVDGAWPVGLGPPPEAGRLVAAAERRIGVPPAAVRQHLLRVIREMSFELRTEQFGLLEAVRGSRLGSVTLAAAKVPVELRITLEPAGAGARIVAVLVDRWPARVGRKWGATAAYVEAFGTVLSTVDATLARLDPAAAASFGPWLRDIGTGDIGMMQNAANVAGRAGAVLTRHTSRVLDGPAAERRRAVVSNTGAATFTFASPDAVADVPTDIADAMHTAGTLIASRPGAMPPKLATQVQHLVLRIEEHLTAYGTATPLGVSAAEVPVVTFLHQQALMRGMLPVRTLRICTTCRLEKVTNPELERIQERTRRTRDIANGLRAVVAPFIMAGQLVQMNAKAPQFTCPRCQGLDADETVVTYCQRCGDRQTESALRTCSRCQFDFRSLLDKPEPLWLKKTPAPPAHTAPPAPAPTAPAAPPAPTAPAAPPAPTAPAAPPAPSPPALWPAPLPPPAPPVAPPVAPPAGPIDSSNWPRPPM